MNVHVHVGVHMYSLTLESHCPRAVSEVVYCGGSAKCVRCLSAAADDDVRETEPPLLE